MELQVAASAHLERLNRLQQRPMAPAGRLRLTRLLADAALLVGTLAYDLHLPAQARAYYQLAKESAREIHDGTAFALALGSEALTRSRLMSGYGNSRHAVMQLREAVRILPPDAPHSARAWLSAHAGKESAAVGEAAPFHAHLGDAEDALARGEDRGPASGFMPRYLEYVDLPGWLDEHRGRGLMLLGQPQAGPVLDAVLASAGRENPRRRATVLIDLMEHHLGNDQPDQAADAGLHALRLGREQGLDRVVAGVQARRDRASQSAAPAMARLDDALAAVW